VTKEAKNNQGLFAGTWSRSGVAVNFCRTAKIDPNYEAGDTKYHISKQFAVSINPEDTRVTTDYFFC